MLFNFYLKNLFFVKFLNTKHRIHLHCFTGGWTIGKAYLNHFENLYIGVTPLLTYNSKEVKDLIQNVPLYRLLLETDAPFFVPHTIDVNNFKT